MTDTLLRSHPEEIGRLIRHSDPEELIFDAHFAVLNVSLFASGLDGYKVSYHQKDRCRKCADVYSDEMSALFEPIFVCVSISPQTYGFGSIWCPISTVCGCFCPPTLVS